MLFPFLFPLPLITPFPSPLPFRAVGEMWPNFWHLKHLTFVKSASHMLALCFLLPHFVHLCPEFPTASKFQSPLPSLAVMSQNSAAPSDSFPSWYNCFLGWNSTKALCCCSHLNAAALKLGTFPHWYDADKTLTLSGSDLNNTALNLLLQLAAINWTCKSTQELAIACILIVDLPDGVRHNSAWACLTNMQTDSCVLGPCENSMLHCGFSDCIP